ncbi:MAG: tetratricopeptide repeat protein [Gammaproteobacteria bacterium]|nr:tetratricopeptide repeat protein [Gammaproteobacteria bacterium]MCW8987824.1 tetratricopeptide repeat protein [Gammaproteobacteria bacterium]MCW9030508.1 tetratricopeptide repeat protein [Gammaproteobacteria bacterium]
MKTFNSYFAHIITLILVLSITACQAPVDKTPGWTSESGEVRPGPKTGKAVLALLNKARQASTKGELSTAESHLERALRIEPQNPALWLYMAKLRLYAAKSKEAINLAKKALAMSSRESNLTRSSRKALQADCWLVIAHAHQKMGDLEEAQKAQDKAKSLSY